MVGLVIVSHSKHLAESVRYLALQAAPDAAIVAIGGTGKSNEEFGTDAFGIMEAIQSVYSESGVIVFMDMGSALLSTKTALGLLDEKIASKVILCAAPIVEGLIVAAVQSSVGADVNTIIEAAGSSLIAKEQQIFLEDTTKGKNSTQETELDNVILPDSSISRSFIIKNIHGLHLRPASQLVQLVYDYQVDAYIQKDNEKGSKLISAKSINGIAQLNITQNQSITMHVSGEKAEEFLEEIERQVSQSFGEKETSAVITTEDTTLDKTIGAQSRIFQGNVDKAQKLVSISRGYGIGKLHIIKQGKPKFTHTISDNIPFECALLKQLIRKSQRAIDNDVAKSSGEMSEILRMHGLILLDPNMYARAKALIEKNHYTAVYAWWNTCQEMAQGYLNIEHNEYLKERAKDIVDVGYRVLSISNNVTITNNEIPKQSIVYVESLFPDLIAKLSQTKVQGIFTSDTSTISHAAIIARSRSMPVIGGISSETVTPNSTVICDANIPKVINNPSQEQMKFYKEKITQTQKMKSKIATSAINNAISQDGIEIECYANVGIVDENTIDELQKSGADGVGLFRSEFLFVDKTQAPSEDEQYKSFVRIAQVCSPGDVIIRMLDIGADKTVSYLPQHKEDNPFLGIRGIRFDFVHEELFKIHIRAVLRAKITCPNIKIILPMIIDEGEISRYLSLQTQVLEDMKKKGIFIPNDIKIDVGIMIETPAAALRASQLSKHASFFSIGTNDLTQYILVVERSNQALSYMFDHCHPAVLKMIQEIVEVSETEGVPLNVCGEMASDIEAVPLLLGLGIRKLSASSTNIPLIKYLCRNITIKKCRDIAHKAMQLKNATKVRVLVAQELPVIEQFVNL